MATERECKKPKHDREQVHVHYGERRCEHPARCENMAYWRQGSAFLCGVHARDKEKRVALPKQPEHEREIIRAEARIAHERTVAERTRENKAAGKPGTVSLRRMRMMHDPVQIPGVLFVFPNFKHQYRRDGFGCSSLSPMSLGPVEHGQPGLPPAANIENFHQGSKCFREEALPGSDDPAPLYYENRLRFYKDAVPHRHKYKGVGPNKNAPLYFVWVDKDGKERRLTYVESRQFYCNFYERLAEKQRDYARLRDMIAAGTDVCICGYDAVPLDPGESLEDAYLDASKSFGHERVLYAMLTAADPELLPWKKHRTFEF